MDDSTLNALKVALISMQSAYDAEVAADDGNDPSYDDAAYSLKSAINSLKRFVLDAWISKQVGLPESIAAIQATWTGSEAGAKLSAATKASLQTVIDALGAMLTPKPTAEGSEPTEVDPQLSAEARKMVEAAIAALDLKLGEAELKAKARNALGDSQFADPKNRKYPIHDKAHADNALARLEQNSDDPNYAAIKKRILAAQKKFGESSPEAIKSSPEAIKAKENKLPALSAPVIIPSGAHQIGLLHPIVLSEGSDPSKNTYRSLVIAEGMSLNRVKYTEKVLRASIPLLEGKPIYVDHPQNARSGGSSERSLATKAGYWENVQYIQDMPFAEATPEGGIAERKISGIVADAHLFESSGVEWLPKMIKEALEAGHPEQIGFSILAAGKAVMGKDEQGIFKEPTEITMYASADAVAEPGAQGRPLALIASDGKDSDVMDLETLTVEELRKTRPELIEALLAEAAKTQPAPEDPAPAKDKSSDPATDTVLAETRTLVSEMQKTLDRQHTSIFLESKLTTSQLPDSVKDVIRADVSAVDGIMAEDRITDLLLKYEQMATAVIGAPNNARNLVGQAFIPYISIKEGLSPLDQVQWSLDEMFGVTVPEELKGKFPRIVSIKEAWVNITGDPECNRVIPARSPLGNLWFREAIPSGTTHIVGANVVTMTNLLGTSINRALVQKYKTQPRWFEPIVTKRPINNFKRQDRIRLHNFGSLTNRPLGYEEYTELDWGETQETYSPTGYGNVATVARRAIINDDLRGIASIPDYMADSATFTINEFVANLITQNSGIGPALADTYNVYNAAQHQGNLIALAMSRTSVLTARKVMRKFVNDASKRIGVIGRHLVIPADLEQTAFELIGSVQVPGSNNNEPNIIAAPQGIADYIICDQFTNTANWYLFADKAQIESIELGFLFGREEPEMFAQRDETEGMMWERDVMGWKIRHEYGAGWVDYRGTVGSIP